MIDGAADPSDYVVYGTTNSGASAARQYPAVTITVAKRKGTNATDIANAVLKSVHQMQGVTIPNDVTVTTTRNYGETAKNKSDELLEHLLLATLSVTLLVALFLGLARIGRRAAGHSGHARAHHVGVLLPGLHHQSRHAVCPDFLASAFLSMTPSSSSRTWCVTSGSRRIMAGR